MHNFSLLELAFIANALDEEESEERRRRIERKNRRKRYYEDSISTLNQEKLIDDSTKNITLNVYKYFKTPNKSLKSIQEQVIKATGLSKETVSKILSDVSVEQILPKSKSRRVNKSTVKKGKNKTVIHVTETHDSNEDEEVALNKIQTKPIETSFVKSEFELDSERESSNDTIPTRNIKEEKNTVLLREPAITINFTPSNEHDYDAYDRLEIKQEYTEETASTGN